MSIQSAVGNIERSVDNTLDTLISGARTSFENILGSLGTSLSNIWDGGFAGIDESNFPVLKEYITKYCSDIEAIISGFNEQARVEVAYKGSVQTASTDFIKAVKDILQAYVSTMKRNIADADLAFKNYAAGAQQISQNVTSDASDIRSEAAKIRLD